MRKVDVKLTDQILWGQSCTLCGARIEKQQVWDNVLPQGHDSDCEGREVTVCPSCLASKDINARIEQNAARFDRQAADSLKRAAWLRSLTGRLNLPAYANYQAAVDESADALEQAMALAKQQTLSP